MSRIVDWVAQPWLNGALGNTPITAERLNNIESQVEGITVDINNLASEYIPVTPDIQVITKMTQAAYDALTPKVATTLYVIVG